MAGASLEHRIVGRGARELDRQHAHLRLLAAVDARAEGRREQLRPEADAPDRHVGLHGVAEQSLLLDEPRVVRLVVGAHRTAHHHDRGELAPVRQRIALVELHPGHVEAPRAQLVLERGRRFAGDVLKDEQ